MVVCFAVLSSVASQPELMLLHTLTADDLLAIAVTKAKHPNDALLNANEVYPVEQANAVGLRVGTELGNREGETVGHVVGNDVGTILGITVGLVGCPEGWPDG